MSLFLTKLPTEVDAFVKTLPKGAHIAGVILCPNTKEIKVVWESERFHSGLSVALDFPPEDIKSKRLPVGVRDLTKPVKAAPVAVVEPPQEEPKTPVEKPVYLTADEIAEAVKAGEKVEYMGITPGWKPFNPESDRVTTGFFYRKVVDTLTVK